jgi:hypothetical protein
VHSLLFAQVVLTEQEMMLRIFDYIDKLVQIIKPQKLLFMAIDGDGIASCCFVFQAWVVGHELCHVAAQEARFALDKCHISRVVLLQICLNLAMAQESPAGVAPRAKLNQQRSRRFKSAKERLQVSHGCE